MSRVIRPAMKYLLSPMKNVQRGTGGMYRDTWGLDLRGGSGGLST